MTFPHMGNTYIVVKTLLDELNVDYIVPPFNSKRTIEKGTKYAPETACLPFKINLGNYIEAYELGADTVITAGGFGPCRFGYYCEISKKILENSKCNLEFVVLEISNGRLDALLKRLFKVVEKKNPLIVIKALQKAIVVSREIDHLEELTFIMRPRQLKKGAVDEILENFKKKVDLVYGFKSVENLIIETRNKLLKVELDYSIRPLKISVVGEIFMTIDNFANMDLFKKLGNLGVEVIRYNSVSRWIKNHLIREKLNLRADNYAKKLSDQYISTPIGGHARETIRNTIISAKEECDGVIHLMPFGCMPEIAAKSILAKVESDYKIPVLKLVIDEHTGEAGFITRLEAFVDCLQRKREVMKENELILSRN